MSKDRGTGAARYVLGAGGLLLLAALLVNPWTAGFWKGDRALDYLDAIASSARVCAIGGVALVLLQGFVRRFGSAALRKTLVLAATLALFAGADRLLLAHFGLPFWIPDQEAHFKNRPNATRLSRAGHAVWRTNSYGYSDDEFPVEKPAGELRGLMVGDSITQGFQLEYQETYPYLLERILDERDSLHDSHQMINAGVAGYAVYQEVAATRAGLRFDPDFVSIGFCMNDVTEPFRVSKEYGGAGVDYHGVQEAANPLAAYLVNETGFGRLVQYLGRDKSSLEFRKRWEDYNVRDMVAAMDDPRYAEAWKLVLGQLDEFYAVAEEAGIPALLIVFPYEFQLADEGWQEPQRILAAHARDHGAAVLDLAPIFFHAIYGADATFEELRASGKGPREIFNAHREAAARYYFDSNHLTAEGARLTAEAIWNKLVEMGLAGG